MSVDFLIVSARHAVLIASLGWVVAFCAGASVRQGEGAAGAGVRIIATLVVPATALAFFGITNRAKSRQEVATWTDVQTVPTVRIVRPEHGPTEQELVLPGNVAAFNTGSLFARASGYTTERSP